MDWSEPWRQSVHGSAELRPFLRGWLGGFLMWAGLFVVMIFFAGEGMSSLHDVGKAVVVAVGFALGMSLVMQLIWLLAPRVIVIGAHGVVITKSESSQVVPWVAIKSFRISTIELPAKIVLIEHSGAEHRLFVATNVPVGAVDAFVREKLREARGDRDHGTASTR